MQTQVLNYSETVEHNGAFRLDAEHYQEQYLNNQQKLIRFGATSLRKLISRPVMTGHTPSMKVESYYGGNIAFVKTDNLREFEITGEFNHHLTKTGNEVIKRSELQTGDLIVTIIGATYKIVGRAALVRKEDLPANINQNIALIRLKKAFSPEFISSYLNCNIGRLALWYLSRQTEQVNLNCREVEKVLIPNVSDLFVRSVKCSYKKAVKYEHQSRGVFLEAQSILLSELGLMNWQPKHALSFIRNYSITKESQRIDAEYFQPKYDTIIELIKNYKGGWEILSDLASIRKCVEVGSSEYKDEGVPFIRVSNLSPFGLTEEKYITEKLYSELVRHQPEQGEILFSKDATPGIAYHLKDKPRKMIPSGGILRLKLKNRQINEEYLMLVLNSLVVREQINRDVGGSVILHWRPDQVKQTLIPVLKNDKQQQIQQKINVSFILRKQSKNILECAKKAVEIAIEKDEKMAINWLAKQTESII